MPLLKDRELMKSGVSLLTHEEAARRIFVDGELPEHLLVEDTWESKEYEVLSGKKIRENCFEDVIEEPTLTHTDNDIDKLIGILEASPRFNQSNIDRLEHEVLFFDRTNNIKFLLRLHQLIEEFKERNVVWGVGRGSAVASYALYLLEVHDINPCQYDIPFYELSKERD